MCRLLRKYDWLWLMCSGEFSNIKRKNMISVHYFTPQRAWWVFIKKKLTKHQYSSWKIWCTNKTFEEISAQNEVEQVDGWSAKCVWSYMTNSCRVSPRPTPNGYGAKAAGGRPTDWNYSIAHQCPSKDGMFSFYFGSWASWWCVVVTTQIWRHDDVIITYWLVVDPCSEEYLKQYICTEDQLKANFTDECFASSALKSPACPAGMYKVTSDIWHLSSPHIRNLSRYTTVKSDVWCVIWCHHWS